MRVFLSTVILFAPLFFATSEEITPKNAPRLSDAELKELREIVGLANQELDDWSGFEAKNHRGEESYSDHLASMNFVLAVQQYRFASAYRDLYKNAMSRLIERAVKKPRTGESIGQMIAVYEMFYRDNRWSAAVTEKRSTPDSFPDELSALIDKPWDRKAFGHPVLAAVDFPNVLVREAVWDDSTETLSFTLEPSGEEPVFVTFRIENLYTNYLALLHQDGKFIAAFDEHAQVAGANTRNLDPGQVEIRTTISGPTRFTLEPME